MVSARKEYRAGGRVLSSTGRSYMLTIRKFLRTLIGAATPFQVLFACILGALLGFLPLASGGTVAAIGLLVLLLILNANLFLAGLVATGTKLLSIASAPIAFELGRILIDGPTRPLAAMLANGPVTAWLGFDHYLTTGGMFLGLVVGIILGLVVSKMVVRLRQVLGGLEEGSDAFRAVMERRPIRWAAWILFGGIPKGGFAAMSERRGSPIRISGTIIAGVFLVLVVTAGWILSDGMARQILASSLTRVNGATVDVEDVRIAWFEGRAEVIGLAVSDRESLDRNLVQASRVAASLDLGAVLRKRLAVDLVAVSDALLDTPRETPGTIDEAAVKSRPSDQAEPGPDAPAPPPEGNLEDYLETARDWTDRLDQIRRVVEDLAGRMPSEGAGDSTPPDPSTDEAGFEAWLREQVDLHGYAGVRAPHLLDQAPRLLVRRVEAKGIRRSENKIPSYDLTLASLSTEPRLVDEPASIELRSSDESVSADLSLGRLAGIPGENRFEVRVNGMPAEKIVGQLVQKENPPFSGGTIDALIAGSFALRPLVTLEGPLEVVLRDSTIRIGDQSANIPELPIRIMISGRIDDPSITLDEEAFAAALQKAGADVLASKAREEANSQVDRGLDNLERKTGISVPDDLRKGIGDAIGGGLDGLFGGGGDKN